MVSRKQYESIVRLLTILAQHLSALSKAFAVGFQSLSQFNRVFRRITGESPTHYREHLHDHRSRTSLAYAA